MRNIDENYELIYLRCIKLYPDMRDLVEKIRLIPPPKRNEAKILCERKANGDSDARKRMTEMYMRTALRLSLSAAIRTSLPLNEIYPEAVIGILEAVNRYNLRNKNTTPFSTAVVSGIQHRIDSYVRTNSSYDHSPQVQKKYCENAVITYDGERYIMDHIYWTHVREILEDAMNMLTDRERIIIRLRYGLDQCERHSIQKIADMYGSDPVRIRSIADKALRKLKRRYDIQRLRQL